MPTALFLYHGTHADIGLGLPARIRAEPKAQNEVGTVIKPTGENQPPGALLDFRVVALPVCP